MKKINARLSSFRYLVLFALLFALVWTWSTDRSPATAQGVPTRMVVIDTEKILLTSNAGKAATAELKKLQEARENQLRAMGQEIKDLQIRINDGSAAAGAAAQLDAKTAALRKAQDDATRELNKARDAMLGRIDDKVMPVINTVAKEMNYAMVFRKFESGLIYTDDSLDVTDTVIARLNSMNPKRPQKAGAARAAFSPDRTCPQVGESVYHAHHRRNNGTRK